MHQPDPVAIAWFDQHQAVVRALAWLSALLMIAYLVVDWFTTPAMLHVTMPLRVVGALSCLLGYRVLKRYDWHRWWVAYVVGVVVLNEALLVYIFLLIHQDVSLAMASHLQLIAAVAVLAVIRTVVRTAVASVLVFCNLGLWWLGAPPDRYWLANTILLGALSLLVLLSELQYRIFTNKLQLTAALEHRANIVQDSDDAILSEDLQGRITSWNPAAERLFGYTSLEMLGHTTAILMPHGLEDEYARDLYATTVQGEVVRHPQTERITKSGERKVVAISMSPLHDSAGRLVGASKIVRDLTEQLRYERAINQRDVMLRMAIETSATGFWAIDENATIRDVNPATLKLTGYERDELIGMRIFELEPYEKPEDRKARIEQCQRDGRVTFETTHRRKDGSLWRAEVTVTYSEEGQCYFCFTNDVTENKRIEQAQWRAANYDLLTGLPNRALLLDRLGKEIKASPRRRGCVVLFFIDLDGFKAVNDAHGHLMGDWLLCEVARRWERCVRATDTLARLGGDEFALLLRSEADPAHAGQLAEKLIAALAQPPIVAQEIDQEVVVGASIGIAVAGGTGLTSVDSLVNEADMAMYEAKRAGKGTYRLRTLGDAKAGVSGPVPPEPPPIPGC